MANTIGNLVAFVSANTTKFREGMANCTADMNKFVKENSKVDRNLTQLSKKFTEFGKTLTVGVTLPIAALAYTAAKAFDKQIKAEAQMNAVLKSTAGISGLTADELKKQANALQKTTLYGDEMTISAQSMLLTFTNIRGELFKQTVPAILDMQTAMQTAGQEGSDLKSVAIRMGKALNDPIKGITALSRVGVAFTEQQKKQIKTMVDGGNTVGAQLIILTELEKEFGGSAAAAAKVGLGPLTQLQNQWGDLQEQFGAIVVRGLTPLINLGKKVIEWFAGLSDGAKKAIVIVSGLAAVVGPLLLVLGTLPKIIALLKIGFASMTGPVGLVILALSALVAGFVIFKGAMEAAKTAQEKVNDVMAEGSASANTELASLNVLLATAKNEKASKEARLTAIEDLQAKYPEYLKNLSLENINSQETANATKMLTDSIIALAQAKAIKARIDEIEVAKLKAQTEGMQTLTTGWDDVKSGVLSIFSPLIGLSNQLDKGAQRFKGLTDESTLLTNKLIELQKSHPETIVDSIIKPTTELSGATGELSGATGELSEKIAAQKEKIKELTAEYGKESDEVKAAEKELLSIQGKTDAYVNTLDQLKAKEKELTDQIYKNTDAGINADLLRDKLNATTEKRIAVEAKYAAALKETSMMKLAAPAFETAALKAPTLTGIDFSKMNVPEKLDVKINLLPIDFSGIKTPVFPPVELDIDNTSIEKFNQSIANAKAITDDLNASYAAIDLKAEIFGDTTNVAKEKTDAYNDALLEMTNQFGAQRIEVLTLKSYYQQLGKTASEALAKVAAAITDISDKAQMIGAPLLSINQLLLDNQKQQSDEFLAQQDGKIKKLNDVKEAELARIDELNISDAARAEMKTAIEDKYAEKTLAIENIIAAEKRKIARKQAIADKASAMFGAIISGAQAVVSALKYGVIFAGIVGGLAAAQVGLIAAQPIPALAKGGIVKSETIARIGEAGPEAIVPLNQLKSEPMELTTRITAQDIELVLKRRTKSLRFLNVI